MELCTPRSLSNLPNPKLFTQTNTKTHLPWPTSHSLEHTSIFVNNSGLRYYSNSALKSTTSEEKSSVTNQYVDEEPLPLPDGVIDKEGETEEADEDSSMVDPMKLLEFFKNLNQELDFDTGSPRLRISLPPLDLEDSNSILLIGGGGLVAIWFAVAVVGAIDSIPVFPKLMEIVGLSYTLWFSTRYLIFKKNRDELASKIDAIKQKVLGADDD